MGAPSIPSTQEVMAQSVRNAGIAPENLDHMEAHATGIYLNDVTEVSAITRVHRPNDDSSDGPLSITSVKTNTGNMMESGGVAGLCRVLLGQQMILRQPNLHLKELNPIMDLDDNPIHFLTECSEYTRKHSFSGTMSQGYGGSNVNMIVWGAMDERKVMPSPGFELNQQYVLYWPGGGGSLEPEAVPREGYYLIGSWNEWTIPEFMERESDGSYGFTMTLGVNGWEQFQIILDKDAQRILHPGFPNAPRESFVMGPDANPEGSWIIDGRCDLYGLPPEEAGGDTEGVTDTPAEGGEVVPKVGTDSAEGRIVKVETVDMGVPGDKYRIHLRIQGKWRVVDWEKIEDVQKDAALPDVCVGRYYVSGSWNAWTFEEMRPSVPGTPEGSVTTWCKEVKLLRPGGSFQISRNRDFAQMFYPGESYGETVGPDEWGDGLNWQLGGVKGDVFRIEFMRIQENGEDLKTVNFTHLRNEPLTNEEHIIGSRPMYAITGTWSRHRELMTFDDQKGFYKAKVTIGMSGKESFQILKDGSQWGVVYPSVPDANPNIQHNLVGPQPGGYSLYWTIGGTEPGTKAPTGAVYEVKLHVESFSHSRPLKVDWERAT